MPAPSLTWASRLESRPRLLAAAVLVGLLAVWAIVAGTAVDRSPAKEGEPTDLDLYQAIVTRMDHGASYYEAVAAEQPTRNYPTRPVMSVREPTLATGISIVGRPAAVALMLTLVAIAVVLSIRTFELTERSRTAWVATVVMAGAGIGTLSRPSVVEQHEVWAALLLYLGAIAWGHDKRIVAGVAVLAASLIRELVFPVLLLGLLLNIVGRRRRGARVWAVMTVVFVVFYGWHAWQVGTMGGPAGPENPGWLALGGWPFVVDAFWNATLLTVFPHWVAAIAVPVGLLGWLGRSGSFFDFGAGILAGFTLLFCVAGRPDNYYWAQLVGALLLPGVVFGVALLSSGLRFQRREKALLTDPLASG